jgi:enamine deaminase RidA (YjgF/YER057c/UK114 family)
MKLSPLLDPMNVEVRLKELGIELPEAPRPAGSYEPWILAGDLLFVSGQFPFEHGQLRFFGQVGADLTEQQGRAAARLSAINVLAQIRAALGGFERLLSLVRVEGHVASVPGWGHAPKVLDGASELFRAVLGERGRHSRTAFSPAVLPLNASVELVVTGWVSPPQRRTRHHS